MSVSSERSTSRGASRSRPASAQRSRKASAQRPRTNSSAQTRGNSAPQAAGNDGERGTMTNIGIGVLGASIGVAGGVLLGRKASQRNRKVLGIPVPNKIDLAGVSKQIGEASRQVGRLAGEVRAVREKAEQVGRSLT
jgi:hypothetical protein